MNLIHLLSEQAHTRPSVPAFVGGRDEHGASLSYHTVEQEAKRGAALLQHRGIGSGDVVLLLQPMTADLYVAIASIFRIGAVAMVPDPSSGVSQLRAACRRCPPDAWIGPGRAHWLRLFVSTVRRIDEPFTTGRWPIPGATRWHEADRPATDVPVAERSEDDPALVTFTSGSTGEPKAAVRTHGLLVAQYHALRNALDLGPGQRDLATLPIFVLANLAAGATTILPNADLRRPAEADIDVLAKQIGNDHPSHTGGSPALYERFLDAGRGTLLDTFERIAVGGAPVFPDFLRRLQKAAPSATILAVYGSTEAEPIAHVEAEAISPDDWTAMEEGYGLLTGRPVDAIDLRILPDRFGTPIGPFSDDEFESLARPPGTPGEIVVAGDHVLPGYLDGVGDEETKFEVDGRRWHRTGDAGRLDEEGRLWLLGRCSARIELGQGASDADTGSSGVIYPFPVECAARLHPGVRRAAYTDHRGDGVLVVEPADDADASSVDLDALRTHLTDRLDVPLASVLRVDAVPVDRRHNAKVDYPALHDLLDRRLR